MRLRCPVCQFSKASLDALETHIAAEHLDYLQYKCLKCDTRRHGREQLKEHCWVAHKLGEGELMSICVEEKKDSELQRLLQEAVDALFLQPPHSASAAISRSRLSVRFKIPSHSRDKSPLFDSPTSSTSTIPISQVKVESDDETTLNTSFVSMRARTDISVCRSRSMSRTPKPMSRSRTVESTTTLSKSSTKSPPTLKAQCKRCSENIVSTAFYMRQHVLKHLFLDENLAYFMCSYPGCHFRHYTQQVVSSHTQSHGEGHFPAKINSDARVIERAQTVVKECFSEEQPMTVGVARPNRKRSRSVASSRARSGSRRRKTVLCRICDKPLVLDNTNLVEHSAIHMQAIHGQIRYHCNLCIFKYTHRGPARAHAALHGQADCIVDQLEKWEVTHIKKVSVECFGDENFLLLRMPDKWRNHSDHQHAYSRALTETQKKTKETAGTSYSVDENTEDDVHAIT